MRIYIFALALLPIVTFGQALSQSELKTLANANGIKYLGGLSEAFQNNQDQGLNWFKNNAFELDKDFTIRMCAGGLCYIRDSNASLMLAVEQEEGDFNGRKLQGQLVRIIDTDMAGTMIATRLNLHKEAAKKSVKMSMKKPTNDAANPEPPDFGAHFDELIMARASEGWARPPSTRNNMTVTLQIGMTTDGTITSVEVVNSSGDTPYDSSVVATMKNIGHLPEIQDMKPGEIAKYRLFQMSFTPDDLAL